MQIEKVIKESCWYTVGTVLSCGPSQVFGLVKGCIDLIGLAIAHAKIVRLEQEISQLSGSSEQKCFTFRAELEQTKSFEKERIRALQSDGLALIPFFGANLAWRVYKKSPSMDASPLAEFGTQQLFENAECFVRQIFYPLSSSVIQGQFQLPDPPFFSPARTVSIEVPDPAGTRSLDTRFYQHNPDNPRPTVVLFHGNMMTCDLMHPWAMHYFKQGCDVLVPTMGGYPKSTACSTSEESTLRDVEAVRCFLQKSTIRQVGYHGLSIGGSLALQAATAPTTATELTPKFVVADQTFTKAADVAGNAVPNVIRPFARGAARASFPAGRTVYFADNAIAETDGLNNKKKAKMLAEKNIPLFVIKSSGDKIMGSNGHNFADDLVQTCYADPEAQQAHTLELEGSHGAFFAKAWYKTEDEVRHAGHDPQHCKRTLDGGFLVKLDTSKLDNFVKRCL